MPRKFLSTAVLAVSFAASSSAQYRIDTIAGGGSMDGQSALSIALAGPYLSLDSAGRLYIANFNEARVYQVNASGRLVLLAGNGIFSFSGDSGPATAAALQFPSGTAVDSAGNLYLSDTYNHRIRKVSNGIITTIAGTGSQGFAGDGGSATTAALNTPQGIAVNSNGDVYFADQYNQRIRKISNGIITTVAGNGVAAYNGDGIAATSASLNYPTRVAFDSSGNLYIADTDNQRIRKITGTTISTVAGNGSQAFSGDGGAATSASLSEPTGIAFDSSGNLYIADRNNYRIRKVTGGVIGTIAGTGAAGFSGDGGAATSALLNFPQGVSVDASGAVYIEDFNNNRVRKISSGIITTVAGGGFSGDGGPPTSAVVTLPYGIAADVSGNTYISEPQTGHIRRISGGVITTIAGNGTDTFSGDNGAATSAGIYAPYGSVADASGTLYFADYGNSRVRKISNGVITTVAGNGSLNFSGDGGAATSAGVRPLAVALDAAGVLYIADYGNNRVRKVVSGIITTVGGNGTPGFSGDGGAATSAELSAPRGLCFDAAGNLYIADGNNVRVRKVASGIITTVAGNGVDGFSGDGGPATSASISIPLAVVTDSAGSLFIADGYNGRIRRVTNGSIVTVAGGAAFEDFSGDGGLAVNAALNLSAALAVDSSGNILIADAGNNRIRQLTPAPVNLISLSPNSAPAGSGSLTLTLNGTGFSADSLVQWNGIALPIIAVNPPQITASVPASLLAVAGSASVTVGSSQPLTFKILAPSIASFSPVTVAPGGPAFTLTVTGANFSPGATVRWNGAPLSTTFVSSTQLTAVVPANLIAVAGTASVSVLSLGVATNAVIFSTGTPAGLVCTPVTAPPVLRFEGLSELLSDVIINCIGGTAGQVNPATFTIFASTNLTSRILNPSTQASEILLLIDDPSPAQQVLNSNVFQGIAGTNSVTFSSIPIKAPGSGNRILRIVNLRGNANALGQTTNKTPTPILGAITATGVTMNSPTVPLGFSSVATGFQLGLNVFSQSDQRTINVNFVEGFASSFKTRVAAGGVQNVPGVLYNTESGFVSPNLVAGAGLADSGTRLMLQFSNVPSGVNVYVPLVPDNNSNAKLVGTDSNGAGNSPVTPINIFGGVYAQIAISGGVGAAVWEVTAADPAAIENLRFHAVLTGMTAPSLGPINILGFPAPLSTSATGTMASATAPLPRFAPTAATQFVNLILTSSSTASTITGTQALASYRPSEVRRGLADTNPPQVQVGSTVSILSGIANNGPGSAPQVTVASNLPANLVFLSCSTSAGGSCAATPGLNGTTVVNAIFIDPIPAGATPVVVVNCMVAQNSPAATVDIVTTVSSAKIDSAPDDNTLLTRFSISATKPSPVIVNLTTLPSHLLVQVGSNPPQASPSITVDQGTSINFKAVTPQADPTGASGKQYVFSSWNNGSASETQSGIYPPIGGGTFTASFQAQYQVNATTSLGGTVALTPAAANNFYSDNSSVQITAAPSPNYVFTGFTGDVVSSVNPLNIVISGKAVNVRANFASLSLVLSQNSAQFGSSPDRKVVTSPQTITVQVPPGSTWTVSKNQSFISVSPTSGIGSGSFTISVAANALPSSGTLSGVVTVTATGASNSPQTVNVGASITTPGITGSFDTPTNGTTGVAGAIAVTGWALDTIEVAKVDVWREKIGSEPVAANGLVYIGDAVFVAGARPDVQQLNPNLPNNNRAGWGYLMLTNGLASGNGVFKIHAIVHNSSGVSMDLGTKTITVDNAHASRPFGTIDTPAQGGTMSGTYTNFGWALTQQPYAIAVDGSTITVTVDGVPMGHPVYGQYRSDIANGFPGLANSAGAIGYYFIDTTQFTNGVHTIAWLVYDNAGRGDGLGSRFINIANSGSTATASPEAIRPAEVSGGNRSIEVEELERIELPLGAAAGYSIVDGQRRPLPPGSSLRGGTFYWQLAPGFFESYPLLFLRPDGVEIPVHVTVHAKTYRRPGGTR